MEEAPIESAIAASFARAEYLRMPVNAKNLEQAIKEYEFILQKEPDNFEALWKISKAYIDILGIKTSGLVVEKDEYIPLLKDLGKKADMYAKAAYNINPRSKHAIGAALQAHGYYSSSIGIIKAILTGAAGRYKKLARKLIGTDDSFQGALGYAALGRFYYMAPWPVGSKKKSKQFYLKALEKHSNLLEPRYYFGMMAIKDKQYDKAREFFQFVITNEPHEIEKIYIHDFIHEAQRMLKKLEKK